MPTTTEKTEVSPEAGEITARYKQWLAREYNAPLPQGLPFKEWAVWGRKLVHGGNRFAWKLAFWLAYGEKHYGQTYLQVAEELGVGRDWLYRAAGAARAFQDTDLNPYLETITVSHARLLANEKLDSEERRKLAAEVVQSKLNCEKTAALVKAYLAYRGKGGEQISEQDTDLSPYLQQEPPVTAQEAGAALAEQIAAKRAETTPQAEQPGCEEGAVTDFFAASVEHGTSVVEPQGPEDAACNWPVRLSIAGVRSLSRLHVLEGEQGRKWTDTGLIELALDEACKARGSAE